MLYSHLDLSGPAICRLFGPADEEVLYPRYERLQASPPRPIPTLTVHARARRPGCAGGSAALGGSADFRFLAKLGDRGRPEQPYDPRGMRARAGADSGVVSPTLPASPSPTLALALAYRYGLLVGGAVAPELGENLPDEVVLVLVQLRFVLAPLGELLLAAHVRHLAEDELERTSGSGITPSPNTQMISTSLSCAGGTLSIPCGAGCK